ncbi:phage tail protein [Ancylomarina salipaludis]|uniref:Phage tail protein n=1 Tax=Ancylomarina salipaludis TaxID=2501299 RepID=A0A4Q1JN47_9BACT|nr:tail fiber protein [Ancylomarina salipaludis]RXQ96088.1 phage tail protein [Ancylomarina salipaludis]
MDAFLSFIGLWPLGWAPNYWSLCWGQTLSINDNTALYSLIGTTYGGDGRVSFMLPDFRGRVPLGYGSGIGLSPNQMGLMAGVEKVKLVSSQIPTHTHTATLSSVGVKFMASALPGTESVPGTNNAKTLAATAGRYPDTIYNSEEPTVELRGVASSGGDIDIQAAGGDHYHTNIQPSLVVNYIICMNGIYPPRQN